MLQLLPTDTCYGLAWEFNEQDYHEIYRLKGRDFTKQLAWLIRDYQDLKRYIKITDEQIDFLKNYPHPWSILWKMWPNFLLPSFLDNEIYQNISLRVAEGCIDANIRDKLSYPMFLTSANISWSQESRTLSGAREFFPWINGFDGGVCDHPPSDILEFWEDVKVKYLRKVSVII